MTCGIYKLVFNGTDKVYIGLSNNIENRFRSHKYNFVNKLSNSKLQEAYQLFGLPKLEILCECLATELSMYEKEAIEIFDSINNGFNTREGGETGSTNMFGELNHKAKHTKDTYIKVFKALVCNCTSYSDIAEEMGVSIQIVDHIASGVSHSKWLSEMFPKEYTNLIELVNNRRTKPIVLIGPDNTINSFRSLSEFSDKYNIPKSTVSGLVTGALKEVRGWKLETPIEYAPKQKEVHKVIDTIGNTIVFKNVLKFCTDHGIPNRKKFIKFLKEGCSGESLYGFTK